MAGAGQGELRTTARWSTAFTLGAVFNAVFQFGFLALITHTIDQRDAGALFEAMAIFTICSNAAELGADSGLLRTMPIFNRRRPEDLRRLAVVALVPALLAATVAAALVYVFAPQLSHVFVHHSPPARTSADLRIIALFLPCSTGSTVICAGLRTWTARQPVLLSNFLTPFARPLLFAAFLLIGANARLAALAWSVPIALVFVLSALAFARRLRPHRPGADLAVPSPAGGEAASPARSFRQIATEFWMFSLPRTFGAIFQILITYLDVLLVGAILSARTAAAYSVASRYVLLATFALAAVVAAVATQLSRLMDAGSYDQANAVYKSSTWWTAAVSWPPLLVLAVFSPLFMTVFGHGYRTGATALTILSLAMLVNIGTGPNGLLLLMSGRSSFNLLLQGLGLGVNIGLNLWLIPRIGLVGAAIAWTATILVTSCLASLILWRSFRIQPFGRGYVAVSAGAFGCFGLLGLATRLTFGCGLAAFLGFAVASTALYAVFLYRARNVLNLDAFQSLLGRLGRLPLGRRRVQATNSAEL